MAVLTTSNLWHHGRGLSLVHRWMVVSGAASVVRRSESRQAMGASGAHLRLIRKLRTGSWSGTYLDGDVRKLCPRLFLRGVLFTVDPDISILVPGCQLVGLRTMFEVSRRKARLWFVILPGISYLAFMAADFGMNDIVESFNRLEEENSRALEARLNAFQRESQMGSKAP